MKKVLLSTAAIAGMAMIANPAAAQVKLELGGWFKGYGAYVDQDDKDGAITDANSVGVVRHTEVHFGGETTLDNGLTVGAHIEAEADGAGGTGDSFDVEESYVYFSGGWGRVNFGAEDGAQYLLQVAAPSADSNVDGIRQFVQPVNYTSMGSAALAAAITADGLDYETNATGYSDKLTYLSPIMNGFQGGLSWTPDVSGTAVTSHDTGAPDLSGVLTDDVAESFGAAYEAALRYEGQFNNVGVIAGLGYTHIDIEDTTAGLLTGDASDDRTVWNAGIDLDIGPFGIGVSYSEDDYGETEVTGGGTRDDEETLVVGVDYTTGPFKLGASYMNQDGTQNIVGVTGNDGIETDRYTGGVVYTYGPGMTFRGSVSHVEHDNVAGLTSGDEVDATSVLLGTQINF